MRLNIKNAMTVLRTYWSKQRATYPALDDYVIIESTEADERILMRPQEFDDLANQLYDNWELRKSKYIQLLKEWNECTGFCGVGGNPSIIKDAADTIVAMQLLKGTEEIKYGSISQQDLEMLLAFLQRNEGKELKIWKE